MNRLLLVLLLTSAAAAGILQVEITDFSKLTGCPMFGYVDRWLLLEDSPANVTRLAGAGVTAVVLSCPERPTHAVVRSDGIELCRLSTDAVEQLRRDGLDVLNLPERPLPLILPDEKNIPRRVLSDTFVQRVISKINPDSIRNHMARLQMFRTRYTPAESCRAAEQYVFDYFRSLGLDSIMFDIYQSGYRNVIGIKLGRRRPDAILVLGAHLDAISEDPWNLAPGMEDNGSGTAVVLEAARVLVNENLEQSVCFCAFTGEEQGLYGSDHYARLLRAQNARVIAMLNYDMIAWPGDSWGMALAGIARRLGQYQMAVMDRYTNLHHRLQVRSFPSDSRSFDLVGYPAVSGYEYGTQPYIWYHTTNDTLGNCDMELAAEVTQAATATLASLAVAPLAPDSLVLADCGNGTSLRASWSHGSEPDLAGYKLLWGTVSTIYTDSISIGCTTAFRIDGLTPGTRYYATIVALDSMGHESGPAAEDSATPSLIPQPPSGVACWPFSFGNAVVWRRSLELDIAGYNIYRSTRSDTGFQRLNSSSLSDTGYRDSSLLSDTMYYYRITAVDSASNESPLSVTVRGKPITLDHGILLVDETRDGNGQPGSPNDPQQDSFWHTILEGYRYTDWDVAHSGVPLAADLGPYSTIVWHADDYSQQLADTAVPGLANYLLHGGRLWYSGWKPILGLVGSGSYPFTFSPGEFFYDYCHLSRAEQQPAADFTGASGRQGYPSVGVDSLKLPSGLRRRLPYVDCLLPHAADTVLTFDSYCGDTFQGKPVGIRWIGSHHRTVILGFPLYYTNDYEAQALARRILEDLGEPFGISERDILPRISSIGLNIHPNPCRDRVSITYALPTSAPARLSLFDITGRVVRSFTVCCSPFFADLRSLRSGIYFCRLETDQATLTRRFELAR